uniref:Uncharacterized protein n=2 Tax=Oryza TaxID=4527 RepID=Q2RB51_ORYSJ|nr:hypothetical protein LOC_Os11g03190 [Oryza sativa Japonica Group]
MAITEEDVPAAKKMKTTTEDDHEEVLLAYPPRKKEDGKKMKKVVKRLGKEEVERLLSVTVTVPTLSKEAMEEDDEEDVREREMLLRAACARTRRCAANIIRYDFVFTTQEFVYNRIERKTKNMAMTEEDVPAAKKMKTTTEDDHEEVLLAYRSRKEDGKKRKKVVRRLGKEEVERLLSLKLAVPTLSEEVVMPMPDDDEDDVWQKEVLLRANRLLRESAIRMRKNQELIRSLFEAKGYVDVEDEVSDDDDMDMEMQPV